MIALDPMAGSAPESVMQWAALVAAISFTICGVLLIPFRRGRLRAFNISVVFVIALVSYRVHAHQATGAVGGWWEAVVWLLLALHGLWGVIGMLWLAGQDAASPAGPGGAPGTRPPLPPRPEPPAVLQDEP